jgi:hypothetical protein
MSKLNRICVAISIIGSTIASGIVIVSCSPKHNMFEQYDFNTPIQLKSKKQSRQLFEIAITKIPNSDQPFDFNDEHSAKKTKVNDLMRSDVFEEYSKNIFY